MTPAVFHELPHVFYIRETRTPARGKRSCMDLVFTPCVPKEGDITLTYWLNFPHKVQLKKKYQFVSAVTEKKKKPTVLPIYVTKLDRPDDQNRGGKIMSRTQYFSKEINERGSLGSYSLVKKAHKCCSSQWSSSCHT